MPERIWVTSRDVFSEGEPKEGSEGSPEGGSPIDGRPPVPSTLDDHNPWEDGVPRKLVREIGKNAVRGAKEEVKRRGPAGTMPGYLTVLVDEFLKSKVNWKRELKSWVGSQIKIGYKRTRKKPNRRFSFDFPGRKSIRSACVWVAIDNSGSVTKKELGQFLGEVAKLLDVVRVIVVIWDTEIRQVFDAKSKRHLKEIAKGIGGGGGTVIDNVFHALRHKGEAIEGIEGSRYLKSNPEGIVVLTDGGLYQWPDADAARGIPVLWAITREQFADAPKFGRKVYIEIGE